MLHYWNRVRGMPTRYFRLDFLEVYPAEKHEGKAALSDGLGQIPNGNPL